jgi:hypothetical protein
MVSAQHTASLNIFSSNIYYAGEEAAQVKLNLADNELCVNEQFTATYRARTRTHTRFQILWIQMHYSVLDKESLEQEVQGGSDMTGTICV